MIGREKMDNTCPHWAESIEPSVKPFYAMRFALCAVQFVSWSE